MHTTCLTLDLRSTSLLTDPAFCRRCCRRCCRNPRVDRDTWYPFFSKCGQCRGYIFGASSDMQRQLGACGCLVALRTSCHAKQPWKLPAPAYTRIMLLTCVCLTVLQRWSSPRPLLSRHSQRKTPPRLSQHGLSKRSSNAAPRSRRPGQVRRI